MNISQPATGGIRPLKNVALTSDLCIVGGGLAGVCCAITSARAGIKCVLIQDRPVLGGNASSEVRLWILGATSHMGNNNRWAREGGVVDEILVENTYRNPEGNPLFLDTLLLEKVVNEPNITLLLNTAVHDLKKNDADAIKSVRAFCSQNSTVYDVRAPLFVDASGDGIMGFLAGAAFRMGVESRQEFGEKLAPLQAGHELLGHTIYFYSKDTGRPVEFVPPSFALRDITKIPRWQDIKIGDYGCRFWWFEFGGKFDTVHETEAIKWELWKIVYGVWNYIKNSGKFPEARTMTLEWVGTIPGKRESRRFEGDYMLTQQDIVEQRRHADAVSFGGWAIDLHPAEGVYSAQPGCTQWHSKGVYQIPYRCLYSRNIKNLFLAGRIISASHVAFGSTRVMATCGHNGQAVGVAAAICLRNNFVPRDLLADQCMVELQQELLRMGQFIPAVAANDTDDLTHTATVAASSELKLSQLRPNGETQLLDNSWAMMLPVRPGRMPKVEFTLDVTAPTTLRVELRVSSNPDNHTPDVMLSTLDFSLTAGAGKKLDLEFPASIDLPRYAFVCLLKNESVSVHLSDQRLTGVLAICHNGNRAVTKSSTQSPPPESGIDTFEFWTPKRRPAGKNIALKVTPPLMAFGVENLANGLTRPTNQPNGWVADFTHEQPVLKLTWAEPQTIGRIELCFDNDFDHPMESVLMVQPERVMPFCVRDILLSTPKRVLAVAGQPVEGQSLLQRKASLTEDRAVLRITGNYRTRLAMHFEQPLHTDLLELRFVVSREEVPVALFAVHCYPPL